MVRINSSKYVDGMQKYGAIFKREEHTGAILSLNNQEPNIC